MPAFNMNFKVPDFSWNIVDFQIRSSFSWLARVRREPWTLRLSTWFFSFPWISTFVAFFYFGQNIIIIIIEKDYKISKLDRPRNCQPHTFFSDILLFADLQHSPGQPAAWAVAISEEKTSRGKTRWKKGKNAPRRFRIHSSCLFPFPNFLMYT